MKPFSKRIKRHHLDVTMAQKAVRQAAMLAGIEKPVSPPTFRYSFATQLLQKGYEIRTLQPDLVAGQGSCPVTRTSKQP
jgi:site-specific recombinase XerD